MRTGIGYDVHKYVDGRCLILGGVQIPFEKGLDGHSDADVVVHALMDAMLGAAALGDIGVHFPDTDDRYLGISSLKLLGEVRTLLDSKGYHLVNADMIIVCQRPRLKDCIGEMRKNIAEVLGTDIDDISIKATTEEWLGFTGDLSGVKAYATCLIENNQQQEN